MAAVRATGRRLMEVPKQSSLGLLVFSSIHSFDSSQASIRPAVLEIFLENATMIIMYALLTAFRLQLYASYVNGACFYIFISLFAIRNISTASPITSGCGQLH
ncbi:hypothetical protein F5146DRAFT_1021892 [Armillaria mellea]|nr:hypothetical protein F5146DRAFT_1021892 [Armillaria mellea]